MSSILASVLTTYRTKLAASPASLTSIDENKPPEDPDGTVHKKFFLRLGEGHRVTSLHGGGVLEYVDELHLSVWWNPENLESTIYEVIADDERNIATTMYTQANRPTGCVQIYGGELVHQDPKTAVKIHRLYRWEVITRETVSL